MKTKPSVFFIGQSLLSYYLLKKLLFFHNKGIIYLAGCITSKDNSLNLDYCNFENLLIKNKIHYLVSNNVNSKKSYYFIKNKKPNLIFCFGWSRLIKKKVLSIPKFTLGYHPTKLPANKGRHPIIWTILLRLKSTASTFFLINEKTDDGTVLNSKIIKVDMKDTSTKLYKKLIKKAVSQIPLIISECTKLLNGKSIKKKIYNKKENFWRKRSIDDGKIDFRMSSKAINALSRALQFPYPNAYFCYQNKIYEVQKAIILKSKNNNNNIEPGKILKLNKKYLDIKTFDGIIRLYCSFPKSIQNNYLK